MPSKWFWCLDKEKIEIEKCLQRQGCRMGERCATIPYLRFAAENREWRGVTPSMAGDGPRIHLLKETTWYTVDPYTKAFASLGVHVHGKLSIHRLTKDVLAEERMEDKDSKGTLDLLEEDEWKDGHFILTDYKTWGSYKAMKAMGLVKEKGTREWYIDPEKADKRETDLQLNRYRITVEKNGFPISRMRVQVIPRDANTVTATGRGIFRQMYIIPVERLPDDKVLTYYQRLGDAVKKGMETGWAPRCGPWECWNGRRCNGYCDVAEACKLLDRAKVVKNLPMWVGSNGD